MDLMIRNFSIGDEQGMLDVWNEAMFKDPIDMSVLIRKVLCDPNFDPETVFVAETDEKIIGFVLAYTRKTPMYGSDLEPDMAWIAAYGVKPEFQHMGVGTKLFQTTFDYLRKDGRTKVSFSPYTPGYFYPGVDEKLYPNALPFMEKMGFDVDEECVAMDIDLTSYYVHDDIKKREMDLRDQGYVFEEISAPYIYSLFRFHLDHFNTDWRRAYSEAISSGLSLSQIFIARKDDVIVGSSIFGAVDKQNERFGPFGVAESERGKGVGTILLNLALESMKKKGFHCAYLLWTEEKERAGYLYKKTGFRVTRRFKILSKKLSLI